VRAVHDWLYAARGRHPERLALEGPERSLTYDELLRAAIGAAAALQELGANRGRRRVALELPAGEDYVIALHGCLMAGVAAVPVDLRLSAAERAARRAQADLSVTDPLSGPDCRGSLHTGTLNDDRLPLAVMHTSGTTSAPKPIVLSHANFLASALGSAVALGLDQAERWLCPMPLTHVGGLSIPIRSAIYGTSTVVHARFETEAVLRELMDPARRITLVSLVPTMLSRLLDAGLVQPPALRWVLLGGGPIAPGLLARAEHAGVPVAPTYGMTEACSQIATFGFPLTGVRLMTVDGEILVRGAIVSEGSTDPNGWLHTGDLGSVDDRGRLTVIGRESDTIVTGGENVAPAEVEAALLEHPDVADAGVHARPDVAWGEIIVAKVVLRADALVDPQALRDFCAQSIARYKVPKAVEFVTELPRTGSGKLRRPELS
jgi:O-succinylbenzoic acid--CoA ligase